MLDKKIIDQITESIKMFEPEKVILFGSQASGLANPDSDIDLFIIKNVPPDEVRNLRIKIKLVLYSNLKNFKSGIDIILDSEERVLSRIAMGDLFYKEIFQKGKVIYA